MNNITVDNLQNISTFRGNGTLQERVALAAASVGQLRLGSSRVYAWPEVIEFARTLMTVNDKIN